MSSGSAGYSRRSLAAKLGIREGGRILLIDPPAGYARLLEPLPRGVEFADAMSGRVDLVQVFCALCAALEALLVELRASLRGDAVLWVSWPKKSSMVASEITEDAIRELALPLGFVDVKVCAIDAVWSGLKLVIRKELR
jgi:hypothetical protein